MRRYCFFLLLFFFVPFSVRAANELSSGVGCEERILSLINGAREYIDVAVYSLNRKNIVQALIDARKRGVRIRILLDRKQLSASKEFVNVFLLSAAGIDVRVHSHQGLMHTKMAIFDGRSASGGSFNWTGPAVRLNDEICNFFIEDPDYAAQHQKYFDTLWEKNTEAFSKRWFRNEGRCGKHWLLRT